jgi:hypothetical protein
VAKVNVCGQVHSYGKEGVVGRIRKLPGVKLTVFPTRAQTPPIWCSSSVRASNGPMRKPQAAFADLHLETWGRVDVRPLCRCNQWYHTLLIYKETHGKTVHDTRLALITVPRAGSNSHSLGLTRQAGQEDAST